MALATVLILTSRETRRDLLVAMLQKAGYAAAWMQDPSRLPTLAVEDTPDAVLADLASLDKGTVDELLRHCRELRVPVLAVVGEDGFSGHPAGDKVDDFLLEPVRPLELEARVQRLLRRSRGREGRQVIRAGELMIDQERYEVNLAGRRVLLTFKEYELLRLLASHPGKVFSREALLSQVWGYDYFGGTRTVDVHIRRLRSKIEDAGHVFVETVRNVGYRFVIPEA